jgi:thiamine pyrophosphate-dependent enzyme
MARKVADLLWEMLANAGVKRCYGIVGDALNPVIDALRRSGKMDTVIKTIERNVLLIRATLRAVQRQREGEGDGNFKFQTRFEIGETAKANAAPAFIFSRGREATDKEIREDSVAAFFPQKHHVRVGFVRAWFCCRLAGSVVSSGRCERGWSAGGSLRGRFLPSWL